MVVLRNAHGVIFKPSDSKESETAPASPDCRHNKPGQAWSQGGVCVSFCSLACDCVLMKRLWGVPGRDLRELSSGKSLRQWPFTSIERHFSVSRTVRLYYLPTYCSYNKIPKIIRL